MHSYLTSKPAVNVVDVCLYAKIAQAELYYTQRAWELYQHHIITSIVKTITGKSICKVLHYYNDLDDSPPIALGMGLMMGTVYCKFCYLPYVLVRKFGAKLNLLV